MTRGQKNVLAVRVASFGIAAVVVLGGLLWKSLRRQRLLEAQLSYAYARSLTEAASGLTAMCQSLSQLQYVENGPLLWSLSAQLLRESALTKQALLSLPLQEEQLEGAGRFLSQSGSFALAMSRSAADSGGLVATHREALENLSAYGEALRDAFSEAAARDSAAELTSRILFLQEGPAVLLGAEQDFSPDPQGIYAAFSAYDEETTDYPSLVYDGPFSDHLSKGSTPAATAAQSAVTQEQAATIAARLTHISREELTFEGIQQSDLPVYAFRGNECSIGVTVKGGYLAYFRCHRTIADETLDAKTAKLRGEQFLESVGMSSMILVYTRQENGLRTLHYVPLTTDGVLCYPDIVKLGVAADNGAILFYEAHNYLMNHTNRNIPSTYIDGDKILENLSPLLLPQSQHLAWIPTDGGSERFCWEIRCLTKTTPQEEVWVYRNALTGLDEDVQVIR